MQTGKEVYVDILQWTIQKWKILNIIYNSITNKKYLWINMTKDTENLYTESYNTLLRNLKRPT